MEKREQMYEGKAKKVYATDDPALCIVSYKDDATAFNGEKRGTIMGKGVINNRLTNRLMRLMEENGVPTHFVEELSDVLMYYFDTLLRYGVTPQEISEAYCAKHSRNMGRDYEKEYRKLH